MTEELRKVWVCVGCDMRVRNDSGRPIPQPAKWEDDRCPKCRVDLAWDEGGTDAENAMAEQLGLRRRGAGQPKLSVAQRHKRVREVVAEHPDWTNQQVADEIGAGYQSVRHDRANLDLPRRGQGWQPVSNDQRAQVERDLRETFDSDKIIAGRAEVSVATVTSIRRKLRLPPCSQRRTAARRVEARAVIAANPELSTSEISERVNLSGPAIREVRAELGIAEPPRRFGPRPKSSKAVPAAV